MRLGGRVERLERRWRGVNPAPRSVEDYTTAELEKVVRQGYVIPADVELTSELLETLIAEGDSE